MGRATCYLQVHSIRAEIAGPAAGVTQLLLGGCPPNVWYQKAWECGGGIRVRETHGRPGDAFPEQFPAGAVSSLTRRVMTASLPGCEED